MNIINSINDILWTYILIALLLGCAFWFTLKTRFVQFRMIGEMVRLLGDSAGELISLIVLFIPLKKKL